MTKNNILTLIYHGLWYTILLGFYLLSGLHSMLLSIAPEALTRGIIIASVTVVFSLIFTALFMKDQGSLGDNFSSNATLMILDVLLVLGAAIGFIFNRITLIEVLSLFIMVVVQFVVILIVMRLKRNSHYRE